VEWERSVQLIEARVPCGRFRFPSGVWLTSHRDLHAQILDVLYGPRKAASGVSSLQVRTGRGRYLIRRDLQSGAVRILTMGGRRPPHPDVLSPGEFILGRTRSEEEAGLRGDRRPLDLEKLRQRDRELAGRINSLRQASSESDDSPAAVAAAMCEGTLKRLAEVQRAVHRLASGEVRALRRDIARDRVISTCARECRSPANLKGASPAAGALEELAREWRSTGSVRGTGRTLQSRGMVAALLAIMVSGAGMATAGFTADDSRLLLTGLTALMAPAVTWASFFVFGTRRRRATAARKTAQEHQAQDLLKRARVLPPDGEMTPAFLLEAAHRTRSRERISGLNDSLSALLPPRAERESREQRLQMLEANVTDRTLQARATLDESDPLLALPGLMIHLEKDLSRDHETLAHELQGQVARRTDRAARRGALIARLERQRRAIARVIRAHLLLRGWEARPRHLTRTIANVLLAHRERHAGWPLFLPVELVPNTDRELHQLIASLADKAGSMPLVVVAPRISVVAEFIRDLPPDQRKRVGPLEHCPSRETEALEVHDAAGGHAG